MSRFERPDLSQHCATFRGEGLWTWRATWLQCQSCPLVLRCQGSVCFVFLKLGARSEALLAEKEAQLHRLREACAGRGLEGWSGGPASLKARGQGKDPSGEIEGASSFPWEPPWRGSDLDLSCLLHDSARPTALFLGDVVFGRRALLQIEHFRTSLVATKELAWTRAFLGGDGQVG